MPTGINGLIVNQTEFHLVHNQNTKIWFYFLYIYDTKILIEKSILPTFFGSKFTYPYSSLSSRPLFPILHILIYFIFLLVSPFYLTFAVFPSYSASNSFFISFLSLSFFSLLPFLFPLSPFSFCFPLSLLKSSFWYLCPSF